MDLSLYSRIAKYSVPNIDISLYIGMLDENENIKKLVDVTEYLQSSEIPLTKNLLDGISNISSADFFFPIKKLTGDLNFLINEIIDVTSHPFIVAYRDTILFNGYIKRYTETSPLGYNPDIINLSFSIIHKSYDLKVNVGEITSNGQTVESFLRNLIDNSKINKTEIEVS